MAISKFSDSRVTLGLPKYPSMKDTNIPNISMACLGYLVADGTSGSFSFTNIPAGHQDLYFILHGRTTQAATATDTGLRFNTDYGVNFSWQFLRNSSGTTGAGTGSSTQISMGNVAGASAPTNSFSVIEGNIMNYASTSYTKQTLTKINADLAGATNHVGFTASLWNSNSAITTVDIFTAAGNWAAGTTCELYGIGTVA